MACCLSEEAKLQKRINEEIERQLSREKSEVGREAKFLILGLDDAGKTTFLKQMKIISCLGYEADKDEHAELIYQYVVSAMQRIVRAMEVLGIIYQNPANVERAMIIASIRSQDVKMLDRKITEAVTGLWKDPGVRECYKHRRDYGLSDSAAYFLCDIKRIADPRYNPTVKDYLRVRTPTKGISEFSFLLDNSPIRLVDVGEQKSEPKKWIHCFEDVSGVMFVVSLSDYDNPRRMEESRELFNTVITTPWFQDSHLLLLLNKKDVFEEKIARRPLRDYFPEYKGPPGDSKASREFIRKWFTELNPARAVYSFYTCATDTEDIKYVLPTLKEIAGLRLFCRRQGDVDASNMFTATISSST